jgi:hypothetical protein
VHSVSESADFKLIVSLLPIRPMRLSVRWSAWWSASWSLGNMTSYLKSQQTSNHC